ncbi:Uncharacterized protein PECH_007524 [Penicillium ucsense]|uniref:TauD/TfdA-like domain-containing protein n=1 Tax=Penicillium ucsense TaxID=2839758 RepID=A0A8J8WI55_9EURO|nr:Uncharacterized protein PECM_004420 [Penicillium ucsense]KAF7738823.1 Uncharacterized protein PECH_007524 [Penicillium ucsense]
MRQNGLMRWEPSHFRAVVRTHPVTGEKALCVNPQFTRSIVGYQKEESDDFLKFLYEHIALLQDVQARIKWKYGTFVAWENRVACPSAIYNWEDDQRRHVARLTPRAEPPYETLFEE